MDGVHDLGGKEGFGPIPIDASDNPFQHPWEERMWAMARAGALTEDITIDWFRHAVERMVPADYLGYRYFQKWCTTYFMLFVDNGTFTLEELERGKIEQPAPPAPALSLEAALAANRGSARSFQVPSDVAPRHKVGETVVTRRHMAADHTRLPAYARGARGQIIAHHGAHLLPDKGAKGIHEGEHLYTVAFTAPELWGEAADPRDSVALELWESYFVPA